MRSISKVTSSSLAVHGAPPRRRVAQAQRSAQNRSIVIGNIHAECLHQPRRQELPNIAKVLEAAKSELCRLFGRTATD
jgi:hypothetical protein